MLLYTWQVPEHLLYPAELLECIKIGNTRASEKKCSSPVCLTGQLGTDFWFSSSCPNLLSLWPEQFVDWISG